MQSGCFLFFLILPISPETCCVGYHRHKRRGLQQNTTHQHYKAVEWEIFMMPCLKRVNQLVEVAWSRTGNGKEEIKGPPVDCGRKFLVEAKYSGSYTCLESGSQLFLHLQVVKRYSSACFNAEENSVDLLIGQEGKIPCPGLNCSDNSNVIWYKGSKAVSEQQRDSCEENGVLRLCQVYEEDTGVYFCDRTVIEQGVRWTFRRAVNVTAVPKHTPKQPRIMYPNGTMTEEVELGQSYALTCEVNFPFEKTFSPKVQWFMHHNGNTGNTSVLPMEKPQQKQVKIQVYKVIQQSIIKEVTPQHLNNTYTCMASNSLGNSSVTIKLKQKSKVRWPSLVGYPIASFLLVAGLGVVLHVKRLELQLIYRCYLQHQKHSKDEKEFDVFLSFLWSDSLSEAAGVSALLPQAGPDPDEKEGLPRLCSKEGEFSQTPLEVLLPQVLEDLWGYRLCLLERDVLPGGAYTNDVVLAIQRSRMLICLLSADYLSNSSAVFVLESGVQALLQNSSPKLQLIWTNRVSASLSKPNPPLPVLVQKALKVLPSLDWASGRPVGATKTFWKSLLRAMPDHRTAPNQ
ncbi:interleukin-18 receptor accessory protein-like [Halichoeres trimaculatus]|uniref:interleukin-18 receptor accessory protein-like n=1 Tax=Halichoeres trimaculatus TaxID=147232 RepID=UPI003D9F7D42